MKRARRRGEGSSSEGFGGSGRDFDAELLYRDDNDKKALESMNEFQREAELARRYEEVARERQRAELLSNAKDRRDGRLEALSDIRARRARMKQLQSKASDTSSNESGEEGEIQERDPSDMESDSEAETSAAAESETPQPLSKPPDESPEPRSAVKKRQTARAEDGDASLFAEERLDFDEKRRKTLSVRMLERLSLDLLNRVRLSTSRIHHILEHPQAEMYLKGCFVKVAPPSSGGHNNNPPTQTSNPSCGLQLDVIVPDAFVCQIVAIKPSHEYTVLINGNNRTCTHTLILRPTPKASAKYDREFSLSELIDAPATQREFDIWIKKLQQFETVDDLAKKMKNKILQLEKFTFTDEDVQQILLRKEESARAALQTRGGLIKETMSLKHQVSSVLSLLSNASTATSQRKELRETLNTLLQKKAAAEAQLAKLGVEPLAVSAHTNAIRDVKASGTTEARKRGSLITSNRRTETKVISAAQAPPASTASAGRGLTGPCNLQSIMGVTHEQQQRIADAYVQLQKTGADLAARIKAAPPPPGAFHAPLMIPNPAKIELPPQCMVISLEEYKRQVAQLASMQLGG